MADYTPTPEIQTNPDGSVTYVYRHPNGPWWTYSIQPTSGGSLVWDPRLGSHALHQNLEVHFPHHSPQERVNEATRRFERDFASFGSSPYPASGDMSGGSTMGQMQAPDENWGFAAPEHPSNYQLMPQMNRVGIMTGPTNAGPPVMTFNSHMQKVSPPVNRSRRKRHTPPCRYHSKKHIRCPSDCTNHRTETPATTASLPEQTMALPGGSSTGQAASGSHQRVDSETVFDTYFDYPGYQAGPSGNDEDSLEHDRDFGNPQSKKHTSNKRLVRLVLLLKRWLAKHTN